MSEITRDEYRELVEIQRRIADLSVEARKIADDCGLTRRELAEKMGNASPSTVQRLVNGAGYNSTLETLMRFAWACGYRVDVQFEKANAEERRTVYRTAETREPPFVWTWPLHTPAHALLATLHAEFTVKNSLSARPGIGQATINEGAHGGSPSLQLRGDLLEAVGRGSGWGEYPSNPLGTLCQSPEA